MPSAGSLMHYANHMSSLPDQDMPEVFGIHKNAQAALMQSDGEAILQTSMKLVL